MNEQEPFLLNKVSTYDMVLLKVIFDLHDQQLRATLLKIYSARHGMQGKHVGDEIEFVSGPSTWGNTSLKVGETALVFLRDLSGILYENAWRGHMVVEEIDGVSHAIFPHLKESADPASPASRAIQDPKRSYARAIAFDDLEKHLLSLIAAQAS